MSNAVQSDRSRDQAAAEKWWAGLNKIERWRKAQAVGTIRPTLLEVYRFHKQQMLKEAAL